jgi:hypothetical protein
MNVINWDVKRIEKTNKTNMHYLKYLLRLLLGLMIITALDIMLKKADVGVGDWWFWITLMLHNGYCYLDYRLTDKDE